MFLSRPLCFLSMAVLVALLALTTHVPHLVTSAQTVAPLSGDESSAATVATMAPTEPLEEQAYRLHFVQWLKEHNKVYSEHELLFRFNVFKANHQFVADHNAKYHAGVHSHRLRLNEFAALTADEFRARLTYRSRRMEVQASKAVEEAGVAAAGKTQAGMASKAGEEDDETYRVVDPIVEKARAKNLTYPQQVDWRSRGMVTPVANQGSCGSCWTFSSSGSMEGAYAQRYGTLVEFSKQQLVDCVKGGIYDCTTGGIMTDAFEYALGATVAGDTADGRRMMDTSAQYPYLGTSGHQCQPSANPVGRFQYYVNVTSFSEDALLVATAYRAGVAVAIDAGHASLQFYDGGIYQEPSCSSTSLNHGVLVVGYGTDAGSGYDYWLVKNSWGTSWGESGYFRMVRNRNNMCGIASDASYIVA